MLKYGIPNFSFHILEITEPYKTREAETKYIVEYRPQYNILKSGGSSLGYNHSDETKQKMRQNYSQSRKDMVGALNRGKSLSPHTKLKLSQSSIDCFKSQEQRDKIKATLIAKTISGNNPKAKPAAVYIWNVEGGVRFLKTYPSLKEVSKHYNINYRILRKLVKLGLPVKKFNIFVKYAYSPNEI